MFCVLLCTTINAMADEIRITNSTATPVHVRIGINDGSDCIPDSWIIVCIDAGGVYYNAGVVGTPFTIRVWERTGPGCSPDWSTESWQHNVSWTSCAVVPVSDTDPYTITWWHPSASVWSVVIEET